MSFEVTCIKDLVDKLNEMSDGCQDDISENDVVIKFLRYESNGDPCYILFVPDTETERGGTLGYTNKLIPYTTTPRYKP